MGTARMIGSPEAEGACGTNRVWRAWPLASQPSPVGRIESGGPHTAAVAAADRRRPERLESHGPSLPQGS